MDEAAQLRRNLARQLVGPRPQIRQVGRGRPAQAESRPSTGCCPEPQHLSGWTGRPAQAESRPSTGCRGDHSPVRLDRPPSSGGISPVNWLLSRDSSVRLDRPPSSGGISPVNWLLLEPQPRQVGQAAQLRRNLARQLVVVKRQLRQVGQAAQLRRYLARQLVVVARGHSTSGWTGRPAQAGISPVQTVVDERFNAVTRPSLSVVTPCHSSRGLPLNQFVLVVQLPPSVAL